MLELGTRHRPLVLWLASVRQQGSIVGSGSFSDHEPGRRVGREVGDPMACAAAAETRTRSGTLGRSNVSTNIVVAFATSLVILAGCAGSSDAGDRGAADDGGTSSSTQIAEPTSSAPSGEVGGVQWKVSEIEIDGEPCLRLEPLQGPSFFCGTAETGAPIEIDRMSSQPGRIGGGVALVGVFGDEVKRVAVTVGDHEVDLQLSRWETGGLLVGAVVLSPEDTATVEASGYAYELFDASGSTGRGGGSEYIAP